MTINSTEQVLERADMVIADLTGQGGYLNPEQSDQFLDEVQEQPTILNEARVVRMNSHTRNVDAIGFASRIMKAANNSMTGATGGAADDGSNDRWLAAADRSKPTIRQVQLISKEVMAEVHLHQEVLEDNIECEDVETRIMRLIAERAALDLEDWGINADDTSGDAYLALGNGYVKRAVSNIVDNLSAGLTPNTFRDAQLAMPQKYLAQLAAMRNYVTTADNIRYRSVISQRATGFGDSALQSAAEINAYGAPLRPVHKMPANTALFTFPQNCLFGIHRQISVETERDIRARSLVVVLHTRIDVNFEDEAAVVKITNIN